MDFEGESAAYDATNDLHQTDTNKQDVQDKGVKRSKKGKDIISLKKNSRERSKVLYSRRKGLFNSGFKLNTMTGADVLVVVQTERERRFYGTGVLREEYLAGKLHGSGSEENPDGSGKSCGNGVVVRELEATPSPTAESNTSRLSAIVGIPRCKRSLDMSSGDPVKKLLMDKPVPVVLGQDVDKIQKK